MADPKIEIKISADSAEEAAQQIEQFNDALKQTESQSKKTKDSSTSLAQQFSQLSTGFNQAAELGMKLFNGLKQVSEEMGRQQGIMHNLAGSVDEAVQRMNGLVSTIDLMESRNKLAAAGLNLTEHQFANVAIAAQRYADMTGGTATEAMDKFAEAVQSGSVEQLTKLGIVITDTSSKARIQEQAMQQLETRFGSTTAQITNTKQAFDFLKTSASNAFTSFSEGMDITADWGRTIGELKESIKTVVAAFGVDLAGGFDLAKAAGQGFSMMLQVTLRVMAQATNALGLFMQGRMEDARKAFQEINVMRTSIQVAGEAMGNEIAQGVIRQMPHEQEPTATSSHASPEIQQQETLEQMAARLREQYAQQHQERLQQVQQQSDAEAQAAQAQIDAMLQQEEAQQRINELKNQENQIARMNARFTQQNTEQMQKNTKIQTTTNNGMQGMLNLAQAIGKAQVNAEGHRKQAFKEALKEWLKGFAIQQAFLGASALAAGIGSIITNQGNAVVKFEEAGIHFALASAAGGAAAGIAKSSKGSSGGGAAQPETKPSSGSSGGDSGGGGGPSTVVVNVQGMPLLTQGQIGREVQNTLTSYNVRYGTT